LDAARRLLREGRYNVTEVALRVGYTNPSKFAAAFKAQFGVSPSQVR
jgi:AraC-like DNA-binding protein